MSWNYKMVQRSGEIAIHEVFYDSDGRVGGWIETPVYPRAESVEDLARELERYAGALKKPLLVDDDV